MLNKLILFNIDRPYYIDSLNDELFEEISFLKSFYYFKSQRIQKVIQLFEFQIKDFLYSRWKSKEKKVSFSKLILQFKIEWKDLIYYI